jgi:hypothetical protein
MKLALTADLRLVRKNPIAKALRVHRQQVVRSRKGYVRKPKHPRKDTSE